MTFPTQFTAISAGTTALPSGTANLLAIANRWAVQVMARGSDPSVPGMIFESSCDGINYAPVLPAAQRGNWFVFDAPAQYVTCILDQNNPTPGAPVDITAVFVVGMSD